MSGVRLFVGDHTGLIHGKREGLAGDCCSSAAHRPQFAGFDSSQVTALLDSGAFSDLGENRLTPETARQRQLDWKKKANANWEEAWEDHALVSYDLLINEVWVIAQRCKQRRTIERAETVVKTTIEAAVYLACQRQQLCPRNLVLSCQGVGAQQYEDCVIEVLRVAKPENWISLGGWYIISRYANWLLEFWIYLLPNLAPNCSSGRSAYSYFRCLISASLGGTVLAGGSVLHSQSAPIALV